ncbi:MAG TPA: MBL fold metallo-hydrolase [Candidatus Paceibacterota bacterium]|nr:MBL fold metallo-hydrolase [Candidatus Paceibacterota bacterium]
MLPFFRSRPTALFFVLFLLGALNAAAYYYVYNPGPETLEVTFLDVGQGDAIIIKGPTGIQMLVDGGRGRAVLRELARAAGPFDRTIDLAVATHPDADHIGGLADVLIRYRVGYFLAPGIESDTNPVRRLEAKVEEEKGLVRILARRGERIHLGGGAYADVLYPDHDVTRSETNAGSIALRVVYGNTAFMLTGDLPVSAENYLVHLAEEGELQSNVLKAGHHGSRTSTGEEWLEAVAPATVVISAGRENPYGHPHDEVLARIRASGAAITSTMDGPVTFRSDGKALVVK